MAAHAHKPKKVTISLLDGSDSSGHRFGVNALASTSDAVWADGPQLISAGRDGCVRCWQLPEKGRGGEARLNFCLEEHTDWANDVVLVPDGGRTSAIISASSDNTLKLWTFAQGGSKAPRCHTLRRHTDFVKALAYASQVRLLASAGCDGSVILWDIQALAPCGGSGEREPRHTDSIYTLSTNASATLVASGSVDKDVRLFKVGWGPSDTSNGNGGKRSSEECTWSR